MAPAMAASAPLKSRLAGASSGRAPARTRIRTQVPSSARLRPSTALSSTVAPAFADRSARIPALIAWARRRSASLTRTSSRSSPRFCSHSASARGLPNCSGRPRLRSQKLLAKACTSASWPGAGARSPGCSSTTRGGEDFVGALLNWGAPRGLVRVALSRAPRVPLPQLPPRQPDRVASGG